MLRRPTEDGIALAARRPLKIFASDPLLGRTFGNRARIDVTNEPLTPGPAGSRIEVIDYDGAQNCHNKPVNLDQSSIRAFEFLPPVDVTFGDFLRAMVTADFELVPDDEFDLRGAMIEAFRLRGIYPDGVGSLAEESLLWENVEHKRKHIGDNVPDPVQEVFFRAARSFDTAWKDPTFMPGSPSQQQYVAVEEGDQIELDIKHDLALAMAQERLKKRGVAEAAAIVLQVRRRSNADLERLSREVKVLVAHSTKLIDVVRESLSW